MKKSFVLIIVLLLGILLASNWAFLYRSETFSPSDLYSGSADGNGTSRVVLLDVPFVRQKDFYCSEASTTMILRYYGYSDVTQEYVNRNIAINFENMLPGLRGYLNCSYTVLDVEGLKDEIAEEDPVMIRLQLGNYLHTVVVVGYEENSFFVHDPSQGKYLKTNIEALQKYWEPVGNMAIVVED